MKILRYTAHVQQELGSKTKSEPWLHIGLSGNSYAIWVWDTRKVIEDGMTGSKNVEQTINGQTALDNHTALKTSNNSVASGFNYAWLEACIRFAARRLKMKPDDLSERDIIRACRGTKFNDAVDSLLHFKEFGKAIDTNK